MEIQGSSYCYRDDKFVSISRSGAAYLSCRDSNVSSPRRIHNEYTASKNSRWLVPSVWHVALNYTNSNLNYYGVINQVCNSINPFKIF